MQPISENTILSSIRKTDRSLEAANRELATGVTVSRPKDSPFFWKVREHLDSDVMVHDALARRFDVLQAQTQEYAATIDLARARVTDIRNQLQLARAGLSDKAVIRATILSKGSDIIKVADQLVSGGKLAKSLATPESTQTPPATFDAANRGFDVKYWNIPLTNLTQFDFNSIPDQIDRVSSVQRTGGNQPFYKSGPANNFAATYTAVLKIDTAGLYNFRSFGDNGIGVYIDGQYRGGNNNYTIFDSFSGDFFLSAGSHEVKLNFFADSNHSELKFHYSGPDTSGAWATVDGNRVVAASGYIEQNNPYAVGGLFPSVGKLLTFEAIDSNATIDALIAEADALTTKLIKAEANTGTLSDRLGGISDIHTTFAAVKRAGKVSLIEPDLTDSAARANAFAARKQLALESLAVLNASDRSILKLFPTIADRKR